jgi:hypothetical protein
MEVIGLRRFPMLLSFAALLLATLPPAAAATPRLTGDTGEDPFWFDALPAELTGTTCGFEFDYDEMCPYDTMSPDVVYAYDALETVVVDISLCRSYYDTKIQVYVDAVIWGTAIECNDDWCRGPNFNGGPYLSHLEDVLLEAGRTYFFVVSGYGGECGDYILEIEESGSCGIDWPVGGIAEGEPDCQDDYYDQHNGGCNTSPHTFQPLGPYWSQVDVAGRSGTYLGAGNPKRDSDWYRITPTAGSELEIHCSAEFPLQIYLLDGGNGCGGIVELGAATAEACETASLYHTVPEGVFWIWVGPSVFEGVPCGATYALTIDGYDDTTTGFPDSGLPDSNAPASAGLALAGLPNPARGRVVLQYQLAEPVPVSMAIYDLAGRRLRGLVDSREQSVGLQRCIWDGRDDAGLAVGAGVYLVRLRAGELSTTQKLILLR